MINSKIIDINFKDSESKQNLTLLIDVIHKFSQDIVSAKSETEIFNILVNDVAKQMYFVDCVVYKVDHSSRTLKQIAAYGEFKIKDGVVSNPLELSFGQGHAGIAAERGKSLLIPDVTKSKDYLFDLTQAGSELVVPVIIQNKVYAVISSEHPEKDFYKEAHQKLCEVINTIAAGALVRINKEVELEKIKVKLESVIERKSSDLDIAIETLSAQYSEMKYYHEKQETLIQEVHHRVTNNLQVISSILRLYISKESKNSSKSLQEIHNRVQVMALIHQNIYKSIEMTLVNISSYLSDLLNYLKSTSKKVSVESSFTVETEHLSIDVLVPFGLYITEVFYFWVDRAKKNGIKNINFNIQLVNSKEDYSFEIIIKDKVETPLNEIIDLNYSEDINCILISALIEQLEGDLEQGFNDVNFINMKFKALI